MKKNTYKFFQNTQCKYFPCHEGAGENFNCLFCYCPLYALGDKCGGNFVYLPSGVKSCEHCTIPHGDVGYEHIMSKIGEITKIAELDAPAKSKNTDYGNPTK